MTRLCLLILLIIVAACSQQQSTPVVSEAETQRVLDHHWEAFIANDLEETMKDYAEESVLITPNATFRGLEEIRQNFINAFERFPRDSTTFKLEKSVVVRDAGYIIWNARTPEFTLRFGTDTFIIQDGKIVSQTFGGVFE